MTGRAYDRQEYRRQRKLALARDGRCLACGSTKDLTTDHRVPTRMGGSDHASNLVTLCRSCHGRKDGGRRYGRRARA